jgi:hypothetical protein
MPKVVSTRRKSARVCESGLLREVSFDPFDAGLYVNGKGNYGIAAKTNKQLTHMRKHWGENIVQR